jgi:hypothetical protein
MKPILSALGVVALLLLSVPAFAASDAANAASPTVAAGCGLDLAQILAAKQDLVCSSREAPAGPIDLAIGPHCCGSGAADACRDFCRQQGPGCKGTIGCRAGECVCTCSC